MTEEKASIVSICRFDGSVALSGVLAIALTSIYFPVRANLGDPNLGTFFGILEVVWPIGLGLAMLLFTWHIFSTYQTAADYVNLILGWAVTGWLGTFLLTGLLILHQQSMGMVIFRPAVVTADMAIGGASFGLVIGGFHVALLDRQEQLRTFRQAVEEAGHCIYFTTPEGTIEYVNPAFEKRTGYSAAEAIGRDPSILNSGEHDGEFFEEMWQTIRAGEVWENEIINRTKAGERIHADQTVAPVFDEEGEEIERFVAINSDITDMKEYEQRLEGLTDQLTALNRVIRHDIRNDMTVIRGWVTHLQGQVEDEEFQNALRKVSRSVEHVIELTDSAKGYVESLTENGELETTPVDIRTIIQQVVESRSETFPNAEIEISGEIPDCSVEANEMLSSVIRNLVNNGVQHNDQAVPEVELTAVDVGEFVEITVEDNGPGITDAQKESVFAKGKHGLDSGGTGIGLYLVQTWVANFGGEVWIEDGDPSGTRFRFDLPKASRQDSGAASSRV